jgi:hypothetical protein
MRKLGNSALANTDASGPWRVHSEKGIKVVSRALLNGTEVSTEVIALIVRDAA